MKCDGLVTLMHPAVHLLTAGKLLLFTWCQWESKCGWKLKGNGLTGHWAEVHSCLLLTQHWRFKLREHLGVKKVDGTEGKMCCDIQIHTVQTLLGGCVTEELSYITMTNTGCWIWPMIQQEKLSPAWQRLWRAQRMTFFKIFGSFAFVDDEWNNKMFKHSRINAHFISIPAEVCFVNFPYRG